MLNKAYVIVYDLFYVLLHFVRKYFIEDFQISVHQGYWLITFSFFDALLLGFGIWVILDS
jgi:hypothetical protein